MKHVMISEVKAHLSGYLAAVRQGETVIICDRRTPIAKLEPLNDEGPAIHKPSVTPEERLRVLKSIEPVADIDQAAVQRAFDESRADRI